MRTTEGYVFLRGKRFYGRFRFQGKDYWRALRDDRGRPVTSLRAAVAALDAMVAPLRLRSQAARAAALAADVRDIRERIVSAEFARTSCAMLWDAYAAEKYPEYRNVKPPYKSRAYLFMRYSLHFAQWADANRLSVADVNADTARQYFTALDVTPASRNDRLRWFKMLFKVLMKGRKVPQEENPFAGLDPVRVMQQGRRALTPEQLRALLAVARGELHALFVIGIYTGLRLGDAATLRWAEVDLGRGIIERVQRKTAGRVRTREDATAKIGINAELGAVLQALVNSGTGGDVPDDYVLPGIAAQYLRNPHQINDQVREAFTAAGMVNRTERPGGAVVVEYGFHSLRHTAISMAANAGASALVAQKMAGHATAAMTAHYTHLSDAAARAAAEKMEI